MIKEEKARAGEKLGNQDPENAPLLATSRWVSPPQRREGSSATCHCVLSHT